MNYLVAALDWGLGHTTRILPLIKELCNNHHQVIIGASPGQETIYEEYFPQLSVIALPSISPKLSAGKQQITAICKFLPRFFQGNRRDRLLVKKAIKIYDIHCILSDNRYGFRNKKVYSILVTHQLNVLLPKQLKFFQPLVQFFIRCYINQFNECRVPDNEPPRNLSGILSLPLPKLKCKVVFIGSLSRLQLSECDNKQINYPEILFLISGPETQRSRFEHIILSELKKLPAHNTYLLVRGLPNATGNNMKNSLNHADGQTLKALIINAKYIICRSGYSTIMDLYCLGRTAMLVPTPGQPEQEYLAVYLQSKGLFCTMEQNVFSLPDALYRLENFNRTAVP
ncbi:MAG: hypothetical protein JXB34_01445 [Bacteroidales bacterium]|nr:hypothetical protein [Bacteroidales bacterium]